MTAHCRAGHTLERSCARPRSDEWTQVIVRMMGYGAVSQPIKPQRMLDPNRQEQPEQYRKMPTISRPSSELKRHWSYELKRCPPEGPRTRAIVTEYDIVRPTTEPHDILVDKDGNVWYTDFGEMFIGKSIRRRSSSPNYPIKNSRTGAYRLLSIELIILQDLVSNDDQARWLPGPEDRRDHYYPLPPEYNDDRVQLNFTGLRYDSTQCGLRASAPSTSSARSRRPTPGAFPPTTCCAQRRHAGIYQVMADSQEHLWMAESPKAILADRCEDQRSDVVRHADREGACATNADRRAGPHPVTSIAPARPRCRRKAEKYIARNTACRRTRSLTGPTSTRTASLGLDR